MACLESLSHTLPKKKKKHYKTQKKQERKCVNWIELNWIELSNEQTHREGVPESKERSTLMAIEQNQTSLYILHFLPLPIIYKWPHSMPPHICLSAPFVSSSLINIPTSFLLWLFEALMLLH